MADRGPPAPQPPLLYHQWYPLFLLWNCLAPPASLRPIPLDWNGLQNQFRQQYAKVINTREQLFHAWRSSHFDENTETLDAYDTCIRLAATLLAYGKPQVLVVFKNALPMRLYWVLFSIEELRLAVEKLREYL